MSIIKQPFRYSYNNVVLWLIGINVLFFVAMHYLGQEWLANLMSMRPRMVIRGWIWSFVTYMFVHANISHILFNMLALFIFGVQVERYMGSKEFLLFYIVTGALAGLFSFIVYYMTGQTMVWLMGASGAVFAVELAYAVFYPNSIIYLWGILPLRAPIMVLGFAAIEIFSMIFRSNSGVAHLTHLAGFGFAWLYLVIRLGISPWRRLRQR
jgi:membrane associated rhomboid family serine protease